jgi:hypothetical protein
MSRDLMHTAEIKDLVRDAYRHVPPPTVAVAHNLYSDEELALVPQSAIDRALGVANHLRARHHPVRRHCARSGMRRWHRHHLGRAPHRPGRPGDRAGLPARDTHPDRERGVRGRPVQRLKRDPPSGGGRDAPGNARRISDVDC